MTNIQRYSLLSLRLATGWYFLYAGLSKLFNPEWSAAGYLKAAKTFPTLYAWFASLEILPAVNFLNKWGLTLLGISLIVGVGMRISTWLGSVLMVLYYFPVLEFPYAEHALIVDTHILLIVILTYLRVADAGVVYGAKNIVGGILPPWMKKLLA